MSVLDAFMSTWSSARATFGQGTPREGAAFDASKQLRQLQTSVESAAPGDRWRGSAADSYAEANRKQGNVLGRMADLDQRLGAEVDRSAAVVAAGRRNLDEVKQWVTDAASSVPPGANREQALMPIARKGIGEVADILKQSNSDLNAIGGRIQAIGNEYKELGGENGKDPGDKPEGDDDPIIGVPGPTPTQIADANNRERLREERARTQADIARLEREGSSGAELAAARKRLAELDAVDTALHHDYEVYLAQVDIPHDYSAPVHAAVAVGNPDTATNVSVTVPGVGSTTKDSLPGMVNEARNLQQTAQDELRQLGRPGSVATIAWMGYDPPANPIHTHSPLDAYRVMADDRRRQGRRPWRRICSRSTPPTRTRTSVCSGTPTGR